MSKNLNKMFFFTLLVILFLQMNVISICAKDTSETVWENEPPSNSSLVEPMIDRTDFTYVLGGSGNWGFIIGDNNKVGETVKITNMNDKSINIIAYTESGKERGSYELGPGESAYVGFYIWDGTYRFKVQFSDYSSGYLYLKMKTAW